MGQVAHSYHFKSYTELFQTKPENPSFYTRIWLLNMPHLILNSKGFKVKCFLAIRVTEIYDHRPWDKITDPRKFWNKMVLSFWFWTITHWTVARVSITDPGYKLHGSTFTVLKLSINF